MGFKLPYQLVSQIPSIKMTLEVDYRGDEVSVENFLRLLTGSDRDPTDQQKTGRKGASKNGFLNGTVKFWGRLPKWTKLYNKIQLGVETKVAVNMFINLKLL